MQKDFREDPRTIVQLQGDQIVVSLPDGTIEYARNAKHAKHIIGLWLMHTEQGRMRWTIEEWIGVDKPTD